MSTSRTSLYTILQREFKNPDIKKRACESSKNILKNHPELTTRIFDNFPCLISQNQLNALTTELQEILLLISESGVAILNNKMELLNELDKKKIIKWEKKIASIAIAELLTEKGHIQKEILELLEWQNCTKELNSSELISSIICAYVGAVNQVIIQKLSKEFELNGNVFLGICSFVNKHCHEWVIDRLDASGFIIQTPEIKKEKYIKLKYDNIIRWPIEKPQPGVFIVLGAIATAAAFLFFKKLPGENAQERSLNDEKITIKPLRH
jgi:hypothetical protein